MENVMKTRSIITSSLAPGTTFAPGIHDLSLDDKKANLEIDALVKDIQDQYKNFKETFANYFEPGEAKSNTVAFDFKQLGNEQFLATLDYEAFNSYSKSIAFGLDGSEELAIAYANRSAVSFRIGNYEDCLLDVNRALEGGYPDHLRKKLRDRKKNCSVQLKRASRRAGFSETHCIQGNETDPIKATIPKEYTEWRKLCNFGNPLLPRSSSKIKLECDEKWGRYITATENIEPGEILSFEKFAALVLLFEVRFNNCSYCLQRCNALIPCPTCTRVMYCSKNCRTQAFSSYHRVECKMLSFKVIQEMRDPDFLPMRMLLVGTEQGQQLKNLMKRLTMRDIFSEKVDPTNKPFVNDYLSLLRTCRTFRASLVRSSVPHALRILVVLQRSEFFENDDPDQDNLNETELFATLLLINHYVSKYPSNGFGINQFFNSYHESIIGAGFCILHSMINHSCNPNVTCFIRNRGNVLFALKPIQKGEQTFGVNPLPARIRTLSDYGFTCECEACINKWPLEDDLRQRRTEFLHKNKKKLLRGVSKMALTIEQKDCACIPDFQILQLVCKYCKWLHDNVKEPSFAIEHCKTTLIKFMILLFDDFTHNNYDFALHNKEQLQLAFIAISNDIRIIPS